MKRQALTLFILSGLFFSFFHPGHPITVDSAATLQTVRALARGELHIPEMMVTRPGREGRHYSYYGPLLPVLSLPGYFLGSRFDDPPPPPGSPDVGWGDWLALNTNQWISAGIVVVFFLVGIELGASVRLSLSMSIACGIGTLVFPYARDYFSQSLCALLLLVAGFGAIRYRASRAGRDLWTLAIASALLPWARMDMGIVVIGVVLWILFLPRNEKLRPRKDLLVATLPLLVSMGGLFLFDRYRWGKWSGSPYGDHSFSVPLIDSIPRFFLSPDLSLFLYNPLLLLAMYFALRNWKEWKGFLIPILAMDLAYLLVIGKFRDFHGGVCPGPRYFLSLVPLNLVPLYFGLVDTKQRSGVLTIAFLVCFAIGVLVNGYEALVDYTISPSAWDYWMERLNRH